MARQKLGDYGKRPGSLIGRGMALGKRLVLAWVERGSGQPGKKVKDYLSRRGMPGPGKEEVFPGGYGLGVPPQGHDVGSMRHRQETALERTATEPLPSSRSLGELMEALGDTSARVRKEAAKELGKRGGPGVEKALQPLLDDDDAEVRRAAVAALRDVGSTAAARVLKEALKREDWEQRTDVAAALRELGWRAEQNEESAFYHVALGEWEEVVRMGRRAVPALVSALQSCGDEGLREGAAAALGRVGDQAATRALIEALKDIHPQVRKAAARSLGATGRRKAVEPLIAALEDADEEVSRAAADALASIGPPAMQPLVAALQEGDVVLRGKIAGIIGKYYQSKERGPLINAFLLSLLKEGDVWSRVRTATILGEIGEPWVVGPLIEALYYYNVREAAREALIRMGEPAVQPLIAALRHHHIAVRKAAAEILREIGDERAVSPLLSALKDRDWEVREAARAALAAIEGRGKGGESAKDRAAL